MSQKKLAKLLKDQDYQITDDINGQTLGILKRGQDQIGRLKSFFQEEFDTELLEIDDIETYDGISFDVRTESGMRYVRMLNVRSV